MAISCVPKDLAEAAKCYCFNRQTADAVLIYLLQQIARDTSTPSELAVKAKCYCFSDAKSRDGVITYLLCQISNGTTPSDCEMLSGVGNPTVLGTTPDFIGQLFHDTNADSYYRSTGLTSADWTVITGGVPCNGMVWGPNATTLDSLFQVGAALSTSETTLTFPTLTSVVGAFDFDAWATGVSISAPALATIGDILDVSSCPALTTLDLPSLQSVGDSLNAFDCTNLVTVDLHSLTTASDVVRFDGDVKLATLDLGSLTSTGADINCSGCTLLSSLNLSSLVTAGWTIDLSDCTSLVTLNLPSLVTASGGITVINCTSLTTVNCPLLVPTNGKQYHLHDNALNAASVNMILARGVANAGYVSGGIRLDGGTNAAPTGQGILDKATLNARLAGLAITN